MPLTPPPWREVSRNRNAVGFMGFNDLQLATDPVIVIPIDGVTPSQETIDAGQYPLADSSGAVVVIINPQNNWIGEAGLDMATLAQLFSTANQRWGDVNPQWPASAITRLSLPEGSPSFTTFVDLVMEPAFGAQGQELLVGTVNPNYSLMVLASFACLGIGFIAAQIGSYNQRRFNRSPRPHEQLAKELKGFDDRYALYSWMLPAPHVFTGPSGVYTFACCVNRPAW